MWDILQGHLRIFYDCKCWGQPPGTVSLEWLWHTCFWRTSDLDVLLVWYLFVLFGSPNRPFLILCIAPTSWTYFLTLGIALRLLVGRNIQEMCVCEAVCSEQAVGKRGLSAGHSQKTVLVLLVCRLGLISHTRSWSRERVNSNCWKS